MMMIGDRKEVILLLQRPGQRWYSLCCIGRKRHYRKDGTCKHTENILSHYVKPKARKLVKVDPWGGKHSGDNGGT